MKRIRHYTALLKATVLQWLEDDVPRMGAAVAFYSMLSIGPLLLLVLSGATFVFGAQAAQGRLLGQIGGLIGPDGAQAIEEILAATEKEDAGPLASIIGFITLLIGASGVFIELQNAMNRIWEVKRKESGIWALVRYRFLSFALVLGTGFLLLISLALSALVAAMLDQGFTALENPWLLSLLNGSISFVVIAMLFACIFKYVPDTHIPWRDVWGGAFFTSALFILGKFLIGLYLGQTALSSAYGAGGSIVVILVWIYYSSQILFFGAEFTAVQKRMKAESGSRVSHPAAGKH